MLALLRKTYLIALVVLLEKGFTTEFIAAFFSKCADVVLNTRRAIIYNNLFLFMLTLFFVENCLTLCQLPIST